MSRVYLVVEGQTEETFVRELLQPFPGKERQAIQRPGLAGRRQHFCKQRWRRTLTNPTSFPI